MITVNLRESPASITKKITEGFASIFNRIVRRNSGRAIREIKESIPAWIKASPPMQDLLTKSGTNSLAAQFGLPVGSAPDAVNAIANAVRDSMTVNIGKINKRDLIGKIEIGIEPLHFRNVLGLREGSVVTEKGVDLHWLNWLLLQGNKIIVSEYSYRPVPGLGRSEGGVMTKDGSFFRVPPKYAGSREDNFITRALNNPEVERQIFNILQRNFK